MLFRWNIVSFLSFSRETSQNECKLNIFKKIIAPQLSATNGGKYMGGGFSEDSDDFNSTGKMFYPGGYNS